MSRLPLQPLLDYLGPVFSFYETGPRPDPRSGGGRRGGTVADRCDVRVLSELLGVGRRQVHRYRVSGIDEYRADRIAQRVFGVHPSVIWGRLWWESAPADDESVAS